MSKKSFRSIFIVVLIVVLILLVLSAYFLFLRKPKAGFIAGHSETITQLPNPGNATSIIMNFSQCSKGSDTVYFGMGSTHFAFEGIKENNCVFYYGTEIENPAWDRTLPFQCSVPTHLDNKTYSVNDFGIGMKELDSYCIKS